AAELLPVARADAERQQIHLAPTVVVVELPVDVPAGPGQQRSDGVAERRLAAVAEMERTGGIGRDELHHDPPATALVAAPEVVVLPQDIVHDGGGRAGTQPEVQEAGARHLDGPNPGPGEVDPPRDLLRDVARRAAERACERERDVARQVSVRGVPRTLELDLRDLDPELLDDL